MYDITTLKKLIKENLNNGKAYNKFVEMVKCQGGKLPIPSNKKLIKTTIISPINGYINTIDTYKLGIALVNLGGGRRYKEQEINYDVGMIIKVKINDYVKINDPLLEIYSLDKLDSNLKNDLLSSINISNKKNRHLKNIYKII